MKKFLPIILFFIILVQINYAQPGNYYVHNGTFGQYIGGSNYINWEETAMLLPPGPGILEQVHVYLYGQKAGIDTIRIVGAPSEGSFPPTIFSAHLNMYAEAYVEYDGNQGWRSIDVSSLNIRCGGNNRIAVQHLIQDGGPYWLMDKNGLYSGYYSSFVNDVYTPNENFYNIRGTLVSLTPGDYLVGLTMKYDHPEGESSAERPAATLIDVTEEAGLPIIKNPMVSVVDINNDDWDDIAIGNRFFLNNNDGTFSETTSQIGNINCFATVWGDIDFDGNIDFFAAKGSGNDKIYYGNGDGTFTEETDDILKANKPTVSPMLFDMDGDGDLDIFVAYGRTTSNGQETYYQDQMFENLGDRKFKDISTAAGIKNAEKSPYYDCWGASLCDYNNDGLTDVFVATYRLAPDLLYRNNGDGTFTNVAAQNGAEGVPTYYEGYFGHGMGSDWGDFDNDGDFDLAVGNLGHPDDRALASNRSLILENTQNGDEFVDKTKDMNLRFLEMNGGICWVDLNNDSWLDIVHGQISYDSYDKVVANPIIYKPSRYYINQGPENNYHLKDVSWEIGGDIHGAWSPVRIDYDNDGDMDMLMASSLENVKLFRNDLNDKGYWFGVILKGNAEAKDVNSNAYGSTVKLYAGEKIFYRNLPGTVLTGRAAQNTNKLHFGLGDIQNVDKIEVTFANGETKTVIPSFDVNVNKYITIKSSEGSSVKNEILNAYALKISPNPVISDAKIEFNLETAQFVTIELFDIRGNLIDIIANENYSAGNNKINLNTVNLASGVYNIRFKAGNNLINKKLILHK